jgi:hypothetical protein
VRRREAQAPRPVNTEADAPVDGHVDEGFWLGLESTVVFLLGRFSVQPISVATLWNRP